MLWFLTSCPFMARMCRFAAMCALRRLLHWFKNDYFTWVNELPCETCQVRELHARCTIENRDCSSLDQDFCMKCIEQDVGTR